MKRVISLNLTLRKPNLLVVLAALLAGANIASATTLVVGNCKSGGYSTIQAAINAAPVGATVQVCPGQYGEQVKITQAVTMESITSSNGDRALIVPPSGGLTQTTTNAYGNSVAYQVLVQNSSGSVNISNMIVYGGGNGVSGADIAGIFYQNSFGTVNGVAADHQSGNGFGVGIWLEGGSLNPSVTVENSFVEEYDFAGILSETGYQPNPELTAKIKGNFVTVTEFTGILIDPGATSIVTSNSMLGNSELTGTGLLIGAGAVGSISGNTVELTAIGIRTYADGVSVTSNRLSLPPTAIDLQTTVGTVKGNILIGPSTGIAFNCNANPNVRSNLINVTFSGLDHVPSGLGTATNKIFNAYTVRTGGC